MVVESVVAFDNVGGAVISCMSGGGGAGDEAEVVRGGKVGFEGIPGFNRRDAIPLGERDAVEPCRRGPIRARKCCCG